MLRYALDGTPARRALAVYVAANSRGDAPLLRQIVERSNPTFERALERVTADLWAAAHPHLDIDRLGAVVTLAYSRIGTHRGQQTWTEAARRTRSGDARHLAADRPFSSVEDELHRSRHASLVGNTGLRRSPSK